MSISDTLEHSCDSTAKWLVREQVIQEWGGGKTVLVAFIDQLWQPQSCSTQQPLSSAESGQMDVGCHTFQPWAHMPESGLWPDDPSLSQSSLRVLALPFPAQIKTSNAQPLLRDSTSWVLFRIAGQPALFLTKGSLFLLSFYRSQIFCPV